MPTVRQRRILEDLGVTCWVDRSRAAALEPPGAVAARSATASSSATATATGRRTALPTELEALLEERPASPSTVRPRPAQASAPRAAAPAVHEGLPPALGCFWVSGTLLLCEAGLTPEERRFCRDLLLAGAALDTIDRASTSHRARLTASSKPQWLAVTASDLVSVSGDFRSAALGLLRKRIETADARRLLICGGPQGTAASWLAASDQDGAFNDQLDPVLAALGARLGRWQRETQPLPVFLLPPIALLRADPERKARLWRWLLEAGCE